ncbi:MAG: hypothetical protein ABF685_28730, partial [Clostridium saccharoperbutylacetonicum]
SVCSHILDIKNIQDDYVYIDNYYNIVNNEHGRIYIKAYKEFYNINKNIMYPLLLDKIIRLRRKIK